MRALLINVLVSIASVVLTLALLELVLVVFFPVPFSIEQNMYFEPDLHTGYRLRPNAVGSFRGGTVRATTNRHGHRSDDVPLAKSENVFRILVLGDSFTVGADVEQRDTYSSQLQDLLNRNSPMKVEVLNAGVGGWGPFEYAQYYDHYGWKFDPDLIVLGFFVGNDILDTDKGFRNTAVLGRRVRRERAADRFLKLEVWLYGHSNLARFVMRRPNAEASEESDCEDFPEWVLSLQRNLAINYRRDFSDIHGKVERTIWQLRRIKKAADERGTPMLVVLIPDEIQTNGGLRKLVFAGPRDYDIDRPQRLMTEGLDREGVPWLDLLPAFRADPRCLYRNTHWNGKGHHLAAAQIFGEVCAVAREGLGACTQEAQLH